jgi:hypothetical protein
MKVMGMIRHIIPTFLEDYGRIWLGHDTILAIHGIRMIEEILSNTYNNQSVIKDYLIFSIFFCGINKPYSF